MVKNISR